MGMIWPRTESVLDVVARFLPGRTVEGDPRLFGERMLTPVARVVGLGSARGTWWLRLVEPVAVVETVGGQRRYLPIRLGGLPAAVVVVGLVAPVVLYLVGRALRGALRG